MEEQHSHSSRQATYPLSAPTRVTPLSAESPPSSLDTAGRAYSCPNGPISKPLRVIAIAVLAGEEVSSQCGGYCATNI